MKIRANWRDRLWGLIINLAIFMVVILSLTAVFALAMPGKLGGIVSLFTFPWLASFLVTHRFRRDREEVDFWSREFTLTWVKILLFLYLFLFACIQLQNLEKYYRYGKREKLAMEQEKWRMIEEYERRLRQNASSSE